MKKTFIEFAYRFRYLAVSFFVLVCFLSACSSDDKNTSSTANSATSIPDAGSRGAQQGDASRLNIAGSSSARPILDSSLVADGGGATSDGGGSVVVDAGTTITDSSLNPEAAANPEAAVEAGQIDSSAIEGGTEGGIPEGGAEGGAEGGTEGGALEGGAEGGALEGGVIEGGTESGANANS